MKINTANHDKYASADINYQPSLCFMASEEIIPTEEEKRKKRDEEMAKSISLFIDVLEIANMFCSSSKILFDKAFQGLAEGIIRELAERYSNYNEKISLEEMIVKIKKGIYAEKEYIVKNNYFLEDEENDKD